MKKKPSRLYSRQIKKYFIPHEENNHQPYFLRNKSSLFLLSLIVFMEVVGMLVFTPIFSGKFDYLASVFPSVLISKTNEERIKIGQNELKTNDLLTAAAQLKANDMAEKSYFAHTSPEGKDPWYWLNLSGYKYNIAGENLAVNFVDSNDVHKAWMNSPTHKENILRNGFTEIGIATAEGIYKGRKAIFVAQFFGEPLPTKHKEEKLSSDISSPPILATEEVDNLEADKIVTEPEEGKSVLGAETNIDETVVSQKKLSWYQKMLSAPKTTLFYMLTSFAILILLAVFLKVFIKVKIQYPKLILNGILILIVIACLIYINHIAAISFSEVL